MTVEAIVRVLDSFPTRRSSDLRRPPIPTRETGVPTGWRARRASAPSLSTDTRNCRDRPRWPCRPTAPAPSITTDSGIRSEEHTSELQSHVNLVFRLLLEKIKHQ